MSLYKEVNYGVYGDDITGEWIGTAGEVLSMKIHCTIRMLNTPIYHQCFICKHDVLFTFKQLKRAPNWDWAEELHREELHRKEIQ